MTNQHVPSAVILVFLDLMVRAAQPAFSSETTSLLVDKAVTSSKITAQENDAMEKELRKRLRTEPANASLHFEFGTFLVKKRISSREGLKHLRWSVKLEPTNPRFSTALGRALLANKDYSGAAKYLQECSWNNGIIGDFELPETVYQLFRRVHQNDSGD